MGVFKYIVEFDDNRDTETVEADSFYLENGMVFFVIDPDEDSRPVALYRLDSIRNIKDESHYVL